MSKYFTLLKKNALNKKSYYPKFSFFFFWNPWVFICFFGGQKRWKRAPAKKRCKEGPHCLHKRFINNISPAVCQIRKTSFIGGELISPEWQTAPPSILMSRRYCWFSFLCPNVRECHFPAKVSTSQKVLTVFSPFLRYLIRSFCRQKNFQKFKSFSKSWDI